MFIIINRTKHCKKAKVYITIRKHKIAHRKREKILYRFCDPILKNVLPKIFRADAIGNFSAFLRFLRHFSFNYSLADFDETFFVFCIKVPSKLIETYKSTKNRSFTRVSTF